MSWWACKSFAKGDHWTVFEAEDRDTARAIAQVHLNRVIFDLTALGDKPPGRLAKYAELSVEKIPALAFNVAALRFVGRSIALYYDNKL